MWRKSWQAREARYKNLLSRTEKRAPSEQNDSSLPLTEEQQAAAQLGTVCHRALERILGPAHQSLAQAVRTAAMAAGASPRAQEAEDLLKPFLQSDLFAQISACKTLACEMPFSFLTPEGEVESGVMDAVLEEADGSVWVLDYKTDRVKPGEEAALLQDKYRLQLGVYRQAAQKLFAGKKVRCSAVFLRTIAAADL